MRHAAVVLLFLLVMADVAPANAGPTLYLGASRDLFRDSAFCRLANDPSDTRLVGRAGVKNRWHLQGNWYVLGYVEHQSCLRGGDSNPGAAPSNAAGFQFEFQLEWFD